MINKKGYKYRRKCENCNNFFTSDKANKMFCGDICTREYFDKKYPQLNENGR